MSKESLPHAVNGGVSNDSCPNADSDDSGTYSQCSRDKEAGLATCRVCHCVESDKRGDAALGFLGITPPLPEAVKSNAEAKPNSNGIPKDVESDFSHAKSVGRESGFVEFISPEGEVFICSTDLEIGSCHHHDALIELGCSCKNDLALVHYACALKWFVSHGSTVCEICGNPAKNIRTSDFKKVVVSLKDYEALRERTASGDPNPAQVHTSSVSQAVSEQPLNTFTEEVAPTENPATKWAVEGTGILLATGLLTVTLAWLIAPRVGKKTARSGLHILLGGICALTVVVFFRFIVLTRIKYGPARYWAILFVFWFLVFGIWASRTHGAHTT
ncbi:PREDICTED: uncharacterized protein LOC18611957 isoform X2 [Theobroma cacao]|uniref:Uncharacterized protein LOC18611957 isoform X2 n=1 Tax=Theobroma cacao TaxID=3641 RepID=A0AB32VSQ2_THECC|nr:PREDICTED: uncharacterized protein LOC18611957 isoform X2 [Theobroma cacao]